jgi:hypothetical protein
MKNEDCEHNPTLEERDIGRIPNQNINLFNFLELKHGKSYLFFSYLQRNLDYGLWSSTDRSVGFMTAWTSVGNKLEESV